jgi:L-seryl-tRNA(Ser) seleniumtransferase
MCRFNLIVCTIRESDLSKHLGEAEAGLRVQTAYARLLLPGDGTMKSEFRSLPSVDKLISDERLKDLEVSCSRPFVVEVARQVLEEGRLSISRGEPAPSSESLVKSVCDRVRTLTEPSLRPVINATGVVLHTNLGRAPLSQEAIAAMEEASKGYTNLEFALETGSRGHRDVHLSSLLCRLTGAEDALVVNNNASAVLLALTALAKRKEVIVSRGQAVEIGGGFRIPDVMRQSGAKLVEVGTTNCTYVADYEQAITPRTAALLRVHSSNFKVVGFAEEVAVADLVRLGEQHGLPVFDDLGSGCLLDTAKFGLSPEPRVQDSVAAGAALALFSGDKLLGGPQAGIIVGRKHLVEKLRKHPLARAVRIDKTRLAALAATLTHYLKGEAEQKIPVWQMISLPLDEIERRAQEWAGHLGTLAAVTGGESVVGGGSLPGSTLPTKLVVVKGLPKAKGPSLVQDLAERLRANRPPVIARIEGNALLLDPRTVLPNEDQAVVQALQDAAKAGETQKLR